MTTEAIIVGEDHRAVLTEIALPEVTPTRVKIQTLISGVSCGTESDCASGRAVYMKRPYITGYQAVGKVIEVGSEVADIKVGDLVVTSGGGLWDLRSLAGGSHARQSVAEAATLVKVSPQTPSLETASYGQLGAVAYEGLTRMKLESGQILAVYGLGVLGQLAGKIAQRLGLRVIGINRSEWKRTKAKELGFDAVCAPEAEAIKEAVKTIGGDKVNHAFDTTGNQEIFNLALETLGRHGELSLAGYYPDKFVVDFDIPHSKNLIIHSPVGFGKWLPDVIKLTESGQLNIDSLITHRIAPGQITEFYTDLVSNHASYLGAVIDWRE